MSYTNGIIPVALEYIPDGYKQPTKQQGQLEKFTYQTWESFSYEDHAQALTKKHGSMCLNAANEYTYNGLRFFWSRAKQNS